MRSVVHHSHGDPTEVLESSVRADPAGPVGNQVLIAVAAAPMHFGDLHSITGSPAFGSPCPIGAEGRTPGFEGMGRIVALGADVDPARGLEIGARVAFFPAPGAWSGRILVGDASVHPVPDRVADVVAAQMMINTVTASLVVGAGHNALTEGQRKDVRVIQTGAGSAVGRIIGAMLEQVGVLSIRLVRSDHGAEILRREVPGGPVISTSLADWRDQVRAIIGEGAVHVAIDGVGGSLLADIALLVAKGATIVNYGSLGGATADIRAFPPRSLKLLGVSIADWDLVTQQQRAKDVAMALKLATERPDLFKVGGVFEIDDVVLAARDVTRAGRDGTTILTF